MKFAEYNCIQQYYIVHLLVTMLTCSVFDVNDAKYLIQCVCVCVCVCMCVCMYVCMYVCVSVCEPSFYRASLVAAYKLICLVQ